MDTTTPTITRAEWIEYSPSTDRIERVRDSRQGEPPAPAELGATLTANLANGSARIIEAAPVMGWKPYTHRLGIVAVDRDGFEAPGGWYLAALEAAS